MQLSSLLKQECCYEVGSLRNMQVFYHLVYEYQKGLRDLCLFTCSDELRERIERALTLQGIFWHICPLPNNKINIFFGMPACLKIIKQFSCEDLNNLTNEEDFILGMMLGYAKPQQYERFLSRQKLCA